MVKLVQLLCPARHCLLCTAYEEESSTFAEACEAINMMLSPKGPFNNYCAAQSFLLRKA